MDAGALPKSPEDIVLRKLQWYREGGEVSERQWTDALGVVRANEDRLDRDYLVHWAEELGLAQPGSYEPRAAMRAVANSTPMRK